MIAIDPGSEHSGYLVVDIHPESISILEAKGNADNKWILEEIRLKSGVLSIEQIRGYGIVAGNDTFDTCEWAGRFMGAFERYGGKVVRCPRLKGGVKVRQVADEKCDTWLTHRTTH